MTTRPLIAALLIAFSATPAAHASYGWPVKPFHAEHPVRGSFGDPRTVFFGPPTRQTLLTGGGKFQFHFGVDISAPNGTAVYPVESGVVTRVTDEEIDVVGAGGRSFEYWHLHAAVRPGQHVTAYATVLGAIARPSSHVHLTELDHGVVVNPLQPGHLAPYADTTAPSVTSVSARRVRGGIELVAAAQDMPSLPVPGAWNGLPVTPARLTWQLKDASGRVVVTTRVAYDVRLHLPAPSTFWGVYARGTHQNMTAFSHYYAYRQPGAYLFRLGTAAVPPGTYEVLVRATDIRGNGGVLSRRIVVR